MPNITKTSGDHLEGGAQDARFEEIEPTLDMDSDMGSDMTEISLEGDGGPPE